MAAASPKFAATVPELWIAPPANPEFDLLCACCTEIDEGDRLLRAIQQKMRWKLLAAMAGHHGVLPAVFQRLSAHGDIPPDALDSLKRLEQLNSRRALWLTNQLLRIAEKFDENRIAFLAYKGPILSQFLYGDVASRQFGDLDLLVRASDVARALSIIRDLGYRSSLSLSPAQEKAYLSIGYEYSFDSDFGRNVLEIKWKILPRFYAIPFDMDSLFSRARTVNIGGSNILSLSPDDLFLVLCIHSAKHGWEKLSWLHDIAALGQSATFDWDAIWREASRFGMKRILAINLELANKFLQLPIPGNIKTYTESDKTVGRFVKTIGARIVAGEHCDVTRSAYFYEFSQLRERLRDRGRFWWRLITTPGIGEWETANLGNPASPLYRGVRMYRLASKLKRRN
jgi:hypothetical protein